LGSSGCSRRSGGLKCWGAYCWMFLGDEGLSGWCLVGSVWWVERGLSEDFVGRYWLRIVWTVDDLLFEVQIQG
jgi:hypothetical protein